MRLSMMLLGVALLCSSAVAQQPYVQIIVPGDLLHVQVFDTPNMDETARVNEDGSFNLLIGGTVHLASLTLEQATRAVETRLIEAQIMYHPHVLVTSVEHDAQNVTVSGQVTRPGPYQIDTPRSVLDAIASSGGLTDVADRNIIVQRGNSGKVIQYFVSNDADQKVADAPLVYPGDRVIVNRAPVSYVLGDVYKPGGYLTIGNDSKLTVLQIVSQAGGTEPSAVPSHAKLIRSNPSGGYTVISLQISDMAKGKKPDMLLQANDIVYIPFSYVRNALSNLSQLFAAATSATIYAAH